MKPPAKPSFVVWLYGLSGAGKSTLANRLHSRLSGMGRPACILDGDVLRRSLCRDLGYSEQDRTENIRRTAEVARILCDCGLIVISALITPLDHQRDLAGSIIGKHRFMPVFIECPVEVCRQRDPKGLYRRFDAGSTTGMTGMDAPFERPRQNHATLATHSSSADECLEALLTSFLGFENSRALPGSIP